MAIDPMLYKKYSGRSGNPTDTLGQALAGSSARKQKRSGRATDGPVFFGLRAHWWFSIFASIAALIILFSMMM